jgi:putative aldouronate transport system substrate-binding protein
MKKKTRLMALLLAMMLVVSMLAACGSSSSTTTTTETENATEESTAAASEETAAAASEEAAPAASEEAAASEAPAEEEAAAEEETVSHLADPIALPLVDEEVHYTCWMPVAPYVSAMINLDTFSQDIAMVANISELTNVYIDFTAVAGGEVEEQAFNLMVAAQDYLDIIGVMQYYSTGVEGAIEDGVIIDIYDDLQTLAPNYWERLSASSDDFLQMVTESGQMGTIAQLLIGSECMGPMIRKDWLDNLGLAVPETLDELHDALLAMHNEYGATAYLTADGNDIDLGSAYNITPGGFNVVDGTVVSAFDTEEYKEYLQMIAPWYSEGLFNDDFFNDSINAIRSDMANDLVSFVDGSAENMGEVYDFAAEGSPIELAAMSYPTLNAGDEIHVGQTGTIIKNTDTWAISTACGDHEALLKLVNWLYSDDAYYVYNWGTEGVTYEIVDGEPQWTDLVVNNDQYNYMFASYLYASGVGSVYYPGVYDISKSHYNYRPEQLEAYDLYQTLSDGAYNLPNYVASSMTLEEQLEYNSFATDMQTYYEEMILQFITGSVSFDQWDDFVNTLHDMGLEKAVEMQQTVYDRCLAKLG